MTQVYRIDVDREAESAYIYFESPQPGVSVHQINVGNSVIFDIGSDGRLVGLEILDPELAARFSSRTAMDQFEASNIPVKLTA